RRTAVLLGDGAGCALIEGGDELSLGLIDYLMCVDAAGEQDVVVPAGGSVLPATVETVRQREHCLFIAGQPVFAAAVQGLSAITSELMARNGLTASNVDWVVPHQANLRILEAVADRLRLPRKKVAVNVDRYGNTSAATIPIALSEWWQDGLLRQGDRIIL